MGPEFGHSRIRVEQVGAESVLESVQPRYRVRTRLFQSANRNGGLLLSRE